MTEASARANDTAQGGLLPREHIDLIKKSSFETERAHRVWQNSSRGMTWCYVGIVASLIVLSWSIFGPAFPEYGGSVAFATFVGFLIYRWSLRKLISQGVAEMQRIERELAEIGVSMSIEGDVAWVGPNGNAAKMGADPRLDRSYG